MEFDFILQLSYTLLSVLIGYKQADSSPNENNLVFNRKINAVVHETEKTIGKGTECEGNVHKTKAKNVTKNMFKKNITETKTVTCAYN